MASHASVDAPSVAVAASPSVATVDDAASVAAAALEASRAHLFWDAFFALEEEQMNKERAAMSATPDSSGVGEAAAASASPLAVIGSDRPAELSPLISGALQTLAVQTARAPAETIEWIASYEELQAAGAFNHPAAPPLRPDSRILIVGCGSSVLGPRLYDAGYRNISSMDVSSVVISRMQREHGEKRPEMRWWVGSCTNMRESVPLDGSFDVVLDKGTADTLMFRTKSRDSHTLLLAMLREVHRVLTPTGAYYCITPRKRLSQLYQVDLHWRVTRVPVRVDGEARRVHKETIILAEQRTRQEGQQDGATAPADGHVEGGRTFEKEEVVRNEAFVQLCVKSPPQSQREGGDGTTVPISSASNLPDHVREAQHLLRRVQQHQASKGVSASAAASAAASVAAASSTPAVPVLSRPLLHDSILCALSSAAPPVIGGEHTQVEVCFEALVAVKRKLSSRLIIYALTVIDNEHTEGAAGGGEEEVPSQTAATAVNGTPAASSASAATKAPPPLDLNKLQVLAPIELFDEAAAASPPSASATATPADDDAARTATLRAAFSATHQLVRRDDRVRVRGLVGLNRAGERVIFMRHIELMEVGERRLASLQQRATYHGLHME